MRLHELFEKRDIPREKMPQLTDVDLEKHHDVDIETAKIADLETSQEDRVEGKVDDIKKKIQAGDHPDPIVVDTNDHIVDGHHRYEAYKDLGYTEIAIKRVDAELDDLVDKYDHTTDDTPVEESEKLPGVRTPGVKEIAAKHGVNPDLIRQQLRKGIKVEYEHTRDRKMSREIALDHLNELPDYYTRLAKMERQ